MVVDDKHSEVDKDCQGKEIRFWRYAPEMLRSIDLGLGVSEDDAREILLLAKTTYKHANVRRLALSEDDFSLNYVDLN